jgi:hypothetical protein
MAILDTIAGAEKRSSNSSDIAVLMQLKLLVTMDSAATEASVSRPIGL